MNSDSRIRQARYEPRAVVRALRCLSGTRVVVALLLAGFCAPAAAELSLKPNLQVGIRYDSNPRLRSSDQQIDSAQGLIVDVHLPMEYRSERSSASLEPRLVYSFYRKKINADLEDKDKYLTGTASRLFRRSSIGASYGYTDLSLRTSELQSAGDSPSGGSGTTFFISDDSQQSWNFQPNWQYQFSRANLISLNGGYTEVRYDEGRVSRRFDYDFKNASAMFQHAFNERHALALQARFTKFDSVNSRLRISNDSQTNGLNLIYNFSWSERTTISADIGWARTKNEVMRPNDINPVTGPFCNPALIPVFPCKTKSDSSNFIGNLTTTHQSEAIEYRVIISQSVTPNSNGAEVLRFNVNASAKITFSRRITGRLGIVAFTQTDVGDSDLDFDRDYIRSNIGLNYRFMRNWYLYGTYSYTFDQQNRVLFDNFKSQNHFVSMGIRFQGEGWRW